MKITDILKAPRRASRLAHIGQHLAAHGLGFVVARLNIQEWLPTVSRLRGITKSPRDVPDLPQRLARVLEELGPTFVKFGQMLSTRPDLLPTDYVEALRRICYDVSPFPADIARSIIEDELGSPIDAVFREFAADPMASGSIAQVHAAVLRDGTEVVVKVRRPGIKRVIDDDLAIMEYLAGQAERVEEFESLHISMMVHEFAQGIRRELNFLTEAANTHKFWEAFGGDQTLRIPKVYWDFTTSRILTLKRVRGRHVSEIIRDRETRHVRPQVARKLLEGFLKQFFEIGAFHADPHSGNILVDERDVVSLLDFGLTGRIGRELRGQLITFLIALGQHHLDFAAELLGEIGEVKPGTRDEFTGEVVSLLDRNFSIPFDKIDLQRSFLDVMQIVRKHDVVMPRDFVLLGKALVSVGGLATELDPRLNIAELAEPYARKLTREKIAPSSLRRALQANTHHVLMLLKALPRDLRDILARAKTGSFNLSVRHTGLEIYLRELDKTGNRLALSIILAAIIMSSTQMIVNNIRPAVRLFGAEMSVLGLLGYVMGFVLGAFLIVGIFRSGRI